MYQDLKNKIVIVTGGAGGIGQATVQGFLEEEAKIAIVDRRRKETLEFLDEEVFKKDLETNLHPTFWCTKEVLPQMINQGHGVIVNISSVNGMVGIGEASYSAAKAGVISLSQSTAVRYGRDGIRCNCLAPGTIKTQSPSWVERLEKDPRALDKIASKIPRKKVGSPEEVALIILFLASEQSVLMNGATIVADGGWTLACGTIKEKECPWWED